MHHIICLELDTCNMHIDIESILLHIYIDLHNYDYKAYAAADVLLSFAIVHHCSASLCFAVEALPLPLLTITISV